MSVSSKSGNMTKIAKLIALAAFVLVFPAKADAQENIINICNQGNTLIWIARVRNEVGWNIRLNRDNYPHRAYGWYTASRGTCVETWRSDVVWSTQMWFSIVYKDRWGTVGAYHFEPEERGLFEAASAFSKDDALFCIPDGNAGSFSMTSENLSRAGTWCDVGATQGIKGINFNFTNRPTANGFWQPFPFLLKWKSGGAGNAFSTRTYTFTVTPDSNVKVWWPLKRYADYATAAISIEGEFPSGVPAPSDGTNSVEPLLGAVAKLVEEAKHKNPSTTPEPASRDVPRQSSFLTALSSGATGISVSYLAEVRPPCDACELITMSSPTSVLRDVAKAKAMGRILSIDFTLKTPTDKDDLDGVKNDDLTIMAGGRSYTWDSLLWPSAGDYRATVRVLFVVPADATRFQLEVKGSAPVSFSWTGIRWVRGAI